MDIKEMTNEELANLANEMLPRVSALGELVGQTFPEKNAGPAIAECVNVLQSCMTILTERANAAGQIHEIDDFGIDDFPTTKPISFEMLKELATKDCIATFKALETIRTNSKDNMVDIQLRTIDVLGTHARELFNALKD
jgi:hypothetical protein